MSSPDDLRELVRRTRLRIDEVAVIRVQQQLITVQSDHRLRESRRLLESSSQRWQARPAPALRQA